MSNDTQTNQHTLRNFGFTVSPRAQRTPRTSSANGSDGGGAHGPGTRTSCDALRAELELVIQQYQDRSVSKLQACSQLVSRLESCVGVEETAREHALGIYMAELDSIEGVRRQVAEYAKNLARNENGTGDGENAPCSNERAGGSDGGRSSGYRAPGGGSRRDGSKRPADDLDDVLGTYVNGGSPEHGGFDDLDHGERGFEPVKKARLSESDMPWHAIRPSNLRRDPRCQETYLLLCKFNEDPKRVRYFLETHPDSPDGFPGSQWECIIKGRACDLNIVLASIYNTSIDQERKASIGDQEISIAVTQPKRAIRTSSEWSDAWSLVARALRFAFPNRNDELLAYEDHIKSQFRSKKVHAHHKVILYDAAVRNKYQGGYKCLLSDTARFQDIYSATLFPDGVEEGSGPINGSNPGGTPSGGGNKTPICRRFNSPGGCRSFMCRYQHACGACKKSGHSKEVCDGVPK